MIDPKKLKMRRSRAQLTQQELADKAKISNVTVCRLETGERTDPPLSVALKIARVLKCRVEEISA